MLRGAVLYAKDLDRLRDFYLALGGEITEATEGEYAVVSSPAADLIVLQAPDPIASQITLFDPPKVRAGTPLKPIVEVSSMEHAKLALIAAGGSILAEAKPWTFRGNQVQDVVDPEGNVVQLWQPIG